MKFSRSLWVAVYSLRLMLASAAPSHGSTGSVLQSQDPASLEYVSPSLPSQAPALLDEVVSSNDVRSMGDRNPLIPLEMLLLDRNRICSKKTNITLHWGSRNVTFNGTWLQARADSAAVMWTLIEDERVKDTYQIRLADPIGRKLFFTTTTADYIQIGGIDTFRYKLKIAHDDQVIIYTDKGCLMPNTAWNVFVFGTEYPCQAFRMRKIVEPFPWKSPAELSPGCALNALKAIEEKDQQFRMGQLAGDGLARMAGGWDDLSPAVRDAAAWAARKALDVNAGN